MATWSSESRNKKSKLNSKKDVEFVGCIKYMWKTNRKRMMKCRQRRIKKIRDSYYYLTRKLKDSHFYFMIVTVISSSLPPVVIVVHVPPLINMINFFFFFLLETIVILLITHDNPNKSMVNQFY